MRGSQSGGTPTLCRCDPRLEVSLDDLPGAVTGVARFLCFADSFPNLSFASLAISSLSLVGLLASRCNLHRVAEPLLVGHRTRRCQSPAVPLQAQVTENVVPLRDVDTRFAHPRCVVPLPLNCSHSVASAVVPLHARCCCRYGTAVDVELRLAWSRSGRCAFADPAAVPLQVRRCYVPDAAAAMLSLRARNRCGRDAAAGTKPLRVRHRCGH